MAHMKPEARPISLLQQPPRWIKMPIFVRIGCPTSYSGWSLHCEIPRGIKVFRANGYHASLNKIPWASLLLRRYEGGISELLNTFPRIASHRYSRSVARHISTGSKLLCLSLGKPPQIFHKLQIQHSALLLVTGKLSTVMRENEPTVGLL